MANKTVNKFVRRLAAAFPRFPMTADSQELYADKLSAWHLNDKQWERALEVIIQGREGQGDIPSLSDIYGFLRAIVAEPKADSDMGWCLFDYQGVRWSKRVYSESGIWKSIQVIYDSPDHKRWHLQRSGTPFQPPGGATNIRVKPDREERDRLQDHRADLERAIKELPL